MSVAIDNPRPAEAFPVGEYLSDELRERGWAIVEFAEILGRPVQAVSEILNGRKEITPTTASEIAAATGTSAETWLRLQDSYRLWKLSQSLPDEKLTDVARRARLASMVPLRELCKRGDIPGGDLDAQERAVCELLDIPSLDATPGWALAARRSESDAPLSSPQLAWLACVRRRAATHSSTTYDVGGLELLAEQLTATVREPEDLLYLPARLAAVGVRLVHTVRFDDSKIDGAAFFDDRGPVIGLSGRIAKLDSVLFTLLHEIAHIHMGHVNERGALDIDLPSTATSVRERQADKTAARWALPKALGIKAPISRGSVLSSAEMLGVHPALIVGRLHHDGVLPWSHLNGLVPGVRSQLETWLEAEMQ
ncbi:MAG TPA: HigA family addiction module antitoxin [Dermatophilaceae bacterium]|jgi:HTH-type transcriptional regulator/antitoxin HigA